MQRFTYPVILTPDEKDGGYVVSCRDVPEVVTQGETIEHAIEEAEGALEAAIEMRIEDGFDIPAPSAKKRGEYLAVLPVAAAMKAALYLAMQEQGISKADLARRMHLDEKETRRMLEGRRDRLRRPPCAGVPENAQTPFRSRQHNAHPRIHCPPRLHRGRHPARRLRLGTDQATCATDCGYARRVSGTGRQCGEGLKKIYG